MDKPWIIRDTREKDNYGWYFEEDLCFSGTKIQLMKTGDYCIDGMEDVLVIDRKGSVTEFCANLTQKRFEKEMIRMSEIKKSIVLLEFEYEQFEGWPFSCGLTRNQISKVRTSAKFLRKRMHQFEDLYGVEFIFAGFQGQELAYKIFREVVNGKKN